MCKLCSWQPQTERRTRKHSPQTLSPLPAPYQWPLHRPHLIGIKNTHAPGVRTFASLVNWKIKEYYKHYIHIPKYKLLINKILLFEGFGLDWLKQGFSNCGTGRAGSNVAFQTKTTHFYISKKIITLYRQTEVLKSLGN